ncbi:SCO family protein [Salinispirillum sp. LH 10-3-1]|uniref:SCO family protein n=1 Tax=Salinispirillum sp. LH 10-3-1 TaxID=2952525 RepID=A0AB38YFV6_9GAMM
MAEVSAQQRITRRQRILLGVCGVALLLAILAGGLYLLGQPQRAPTVQGIVLYPSPKVPDFQVTDHQNRPFTQAELKGRWHLVSYGFTHCPQFCASTLASVAALTRLLAEEDSAYADVGLLFYSVDAERDTPAQLARYVTHFHPDLIGLTHTGAPGERFVPFERGLGITYQRVASHLGAHNVRSFDQSTSVSRTAVTTNTDYTVNHGVKLVLLNPDGQLQAVFEPSFHPYHGLHYFSLAQLKEDYLAVRRHFEYP